MKLEPVVRSFETLDAAVEARAALVAGGISPESVQTQVIQDEAGPVEGNFWVGNGRPDDAATQSAVVGGSDVPYAKNFQNTVMRGVHMVLVHVSDDGMRERANGILERVGGVDPVARADQARH